MSKAKAGWVPERQEIIWIDRHPFLVLSPKAFNERTSLVIGLPMTTAEYNASNPFAVIAVIAGGAKTGKTSYVLCHQPKSFDWRVREAAPHPMGRLADAVFAEVCGVLNQIVQLGT